MTPSIQNFRTDLLSWYDAHHRNLPWRAPPGGTPNPYHVWLSEIMLQQTTVPTVIPYFLTFIRTWPTLPDLAKASLDDVFHAWQGLGYYQRARNMLACAQQVVERHQGHLPSSLKELLALPGIGPYTAGAIRCIAFNEPELVMDGNIERVMARVLNFQGLIPDAKKELGEQLRPFCSESRPGDYVQALMDLGSSICTPTSPTCEQCPVANQCVAYHENNAQNLPKKAPKRQKNTRFGTIFWIKNPKNGHVFIQKRPKKGLLAGLMELPSTEWGPEKTALSSDAPVIKHTFTHFHLELTLKLCSSFPEGIDPSLGQWCLPENLKQHAFPTVMKKVIKAAMEREAAQDKHPF